MNRQDYIKLPLREYNRLPILETNVMDTLDDISVMRAMIDGLRKYADYLESVTKERETEIWDKMKCEDDAKHFEDYMNPPQESREPDPCKIPDYEGKFNCPFDSNGPDDCRRHCGAGVDE